jgi:hypothetical protein
MENEKKPLEEVTLTSEQAYRAAEGINYSSLSNLATSPQKYKNPGKVEGVHIDKGTAVDVLLTDGREAFSKQFTYMEFIPPTGMPLEVLKLVHLKDKMGEAGTNEDLVLQAAQDLNYGQTWKPDTIVTKVLDIPGARAYLEFLKTSEGKIQLSPTDYVDVCNAASTLRSHAFTTQYFSNTEGIMGEGGEEMPGATIDNVERKYQIPLFFEITSEDVPGLEFPMKGKALLDLAMFNHEEKTIQPVDLKTSGVYTSQFMTSFRKYKYHLQASYYSFALSKVYPGYKILPFKFVVVSFLQIQNPLVFKLTNKVLLQGANGHTDVISGYHKKGWKELVLDLAWHEKTQNWVYPKEVYENQGEVLIDNI